MPTLTDKTARSTNDPAKFSTSPTCHHCNAPAADGTVRTISGERWFTCSNGHLNAETIDPFVEAA